MLTLIVILAFLTGALLAVGLTGAPPRPGAIAARLERIAAAPEAAHPHGPRSSEATARPDPITRLLRWLAGRHGNTPALRLRLEQAGRPARLDAPAFLGLRLLCALLFLLLAPPAAKFLAADMPLKMVIVLLDLVIGLSLPEAWLQAKIRTRQSQIRKALPDTLDLLVVSMEAGVGFDAATALAAERMRGPLADELRRVQQEMRLGRTRAEALREMAARVDLAEVSSVVSAVTQADRLGAGVTHPLRVQSETVRAQRLLHVREEAARLPTKMLFPLVFCLLPALFVVILGPGLINLLRALAH